MTVQVVDTVAFDRDWQRWATREAPADVVFAVNEVAKEFRRELVAASPRGSGAGPARQRQRSLRGARGRGYGPIAKAWSRRQTKSIEKPATVFNRAFYAPILELGGAAHRIRARHSPVLAAGPAGPVFGREVQHPGVRARPFVGPVVNRAPAIMNRVLERVLPVRRARPGRLPA